MDILSRGISVQNTAAQSVQKGLGGITTSIGKGVQGVGNVVGIKQTDKEKRPGEGDAHAQSHQKPDPDQAKSSIEPQAQGTEKSGFASGITTTIFAPVKSGAAISHDALKSGFSIGQTVLRSGLDAGTNVVTGTANLTGTALGGVISAAAESSGAVFEPVTSGLRTIRGLEELGKGIEAINGLSIGAVQQVSQLTMKAINMSGKTPIFFDPDSDGVVKVSDTIRGLLLLGLDNRNASYAAYALHTLFAYPTSDKWLPTLGLDLPIHVERMGKTSWGRNWGNFERVEWVDDVEVDKFFVESNTPKTWSEKLKEGRQALGALLLIFGERLGRSTCPTFPSRRSPFPMTLERLLGKRFSRPSSPTSKNPKLLKQTRTMELNPRPKRLRKVEGYCIV